MQIKILGTIVSPDYDDPFFGTWITKGVITPSSRVVTAVETATEPIDLYINSYGGDVFAGGEMMIALLKAQASGKLASVEVGSLAASMAANIVAALKANGGKVTGHANTTLMYHGCYTLAEGGAQHLEDVADNLRSINDAVIANLNKIGIKDCRAWFAEGREKWIDAPEAKALGIIDTIAEDAASEPPQMKQTAARLAALATHFTTRQEYKMKIDETVKPVAAEEPQSEPAPATAEEPQTAETAETAEPAPAQEPTAEPAPAADADIEERVQQRASERFAALQAKHDKMISDLTKERDTARADLATAQAEATSLRADIDKLKADLAAVRDQLAQSERNRESVVASALKPTPPKTADGKSARQTLAALPPSKRAEFYKAHRAEIDGTK